MEFYKAKLLPSPQGLQIWLTIFKSIHETEHCYFCVQANDYARAKRAISLSNEKNPVTALNKANTFRVRKIMKSGSRVASKSKDDAIKNLVYRTTLRINHLELALKFCHAFLKNKDNLNTDFDNGIQLIMNVENTEEVVNESMFWN
jgi:hypothetical protein